MSKWVYFTGERFYAELVYDVAQQHMHTTAGELGYMLNVY